jgi:hypothetical protein
MAALLAALLLAAGPEPVAVRTSEALVPCVLAAGKAFQQATGRALAVEAGLRGGQADVILAFGVEMTRAVEGGTAADSEVSVARIPWVLSLPAGNPAGIHTLQDLDRDGVEVDVWAGPAAYEARRALDGMRSARVREQEDVDLLRRAPVALVPLSIAGSGERVKVDLPALVAEAALARGARHPDAARQLLRFLGSEDGQKAFASCGAAR